MPAVIGRISEIWRFPVKSMAGERVDTAELSALGVVGDRRHALRDVATNKILSAKQPKIGTALLGCRAWTSGDEVKVRVGTTTFGPERRVELDVALTELLGRAVRLESTATADDVYESYWPPIEGLALSDVTTDFPVAMFTEKGTFVDLAALHLVGEASLRALRRLAPGSTITTRRFRPSIVIDTGEAAGFVENEWAGRGARLGGATILFGTASPRCIMTTLEQGDLPRDPQVLQALAANNRIMFEGFGNFACLGAYAEVATPGAIAVGDELLLDV